MEESGLEKRMNPNRRKMWFGLALVVFGLMLLSNSTGIFFFSFGDLISALWPLALIGLGFWLIVRRKQYQRRAWIHVHTVDPDSFAGMADTGKADPNQQAGSDEAPSYSNTGNLKYSKMFGDMFISLAGREIRSVDISSFVGDTEIRLHEAKLSKGLNRMVLSGFIGDVRILVPANMPIYAQCSNFIGDINLMGHHTSGFGNNLDFQSPNYADADAKLYIACNHFIGDVRLYVV